MGNINKLLFLLIFVFVFVFSSVSAESSFIYEKGSSPNFKVSCFNEDKQVCGVGTDCYLTVFNPDSVLLIDDGLMSNNGQFYNYSFSNSETNSLGDYSALVYCTGSTETFGSFIYEVTNSGEKPLDSAGTNWVAIILALGILTFMYGYFAVNLKESKLQNLKSYIFLVSLVNALFLVVIAYMVSLNPSDPLSYTIIGFTILSVNVLAFIVFVWMYGHYLINRNTGGGE
jgi:hypothetical protein